jgi:hypothetical protein
VTRPTELTQELFIKPGFDLRTDNADHRPARLTIVNLPKDKLRGRWNSPEGQTILGQWKGNNYNRTILNSLVGRFDGQTDLRGIPLSGSDMKKADLSYIDFFSSDFQNADLTRADLTHSYLSESNIKGAKFDSANMSKALIDNATFDQRTSFLGVNLPNVDFNLAPLIKQQAEDQARIDSLKQKSPVLASFLEITCDYGRSFQRFFIWCVVVIVIFAILFANVPGVIAQPDMWSSFYVSLSTFTTLGSTIGITSQIGEVLVACEVTIGYLMTGLLVSILVRNTIGR